MTERADAIVIGAGPNGLVAGILLAEAGWDVVVLEAGDQAGGAVRSAELTVPGFTHDLFSSFYPLGAASPVLDGLGLEDEGLRWRRADVAVAHPRLDGSCAILSRELEETSESLERFAAGDGDAWRRLYALWEHAGREVVGTLMAPFPPIRAGLRLGVKLGPQGLARFLRFALLPVGRLGTEVFCGDGGRRLMAGNALHADLSPDSAGGALFAWLLGGLGQQIGFPVPQGGAGRLAEALVARLTAAGGRLVVSRRATRIVVNGGRVSGVVVEGDELWTARRAVLASVGAPALYLKLLDRDVVPSRVIADIGRFQYDNATFKIDWALDGPIPWATEDTRRAGTVHIAEGVDALSTQASDLSRGLIPERPFIILGQYASYDDTRQPPGTETAWAYTHLPQKIHGDAGPDGLTGSWDEHETRTFVERTEAQVEALAPGFRQLIRARHIFTPHTMERANANLVNGALNGGTAQLHQQLVLRPIPGLGRSETPINGLFLASASAHPGGGVHGACGANAARAALRHQAWMPLSKIARRSRLSASHGD
jgi:phytoene dehydrogenase-like protein